MKLLAIYSTLHISLHNIFVEKENIMDYNFIGLFLIFTNFFCNIMLPLVPKGNIALKYIL